MASRGVRGRGWSRGGAGAAALALVAAGLLTGPPAAAAVPGCASALAGDVNGDGQAEVAVGEPFNARTSGATHVFYGQVEGLVVDPSGTALNDQYFTQNTTGVPGTSEDGDTFGFSNLLADFNGDGCADLAVGAPGENNGSGMVVVMYGSPGGIVTAGAQWFTENTLFGAGSAKIGESFGTALAGGDLDDDGYLDLVVGAPGELVNGVSFAGGVAVLYGATGGLNTGSRAATLLTQAGDVVPGVPEEVDRFGQAVATGDFNGDGVQDLAVGVPGENLAEGRVQVLPGVANASLGSAPGRTYGQNTTGVPGAVEADDQFGAAVAAGDATGDGRDDLAVGAPGENSGGAQEFLGQGAVSFLRGSATGLTGAQAQTWTQNSPGVEGKAGRDDQFGASLAMGPLDNGPLADVAIGAPFDAVGPVPQAGSVTLMLGSASGLTTAGPGGSRFHQNTPGIAGASEELDFLGFSVALAFVQTPDQANLIIGAPAEDIHGIPGTGQFHQLTTNEFGPNPFGSRTFHLDTPGVQGLPGGGFGYSFG